MQICLVTAPTISDFVDPEVTLGAHTSRGPQLGVVCLAASVEAHGHSVNLVDLDYIAVNTLRSAGKQISPEDLFAAFVSELAPVDATVFGFSTICGSYPITIRLAKEVKRLHPGSYIVLGGPQASVVDIPTLNAFEWIDFIVRGEADWTFPALLNEIENSGQSLDFNCLRGVTYRSTGSVLRSQSAPLVDDLDALPLPSFELDKNIRERKTAHLELGRGCPYDCSFCSTNDFFRRNFRLKSANKMLAQMRELNQRYGVKAFTLVHDMFTVNRKKVEEFARTLIDSGESFEWSCSARTDRVDEELLSIMAKAGCRGIFFGVETGSRRMQEVINKHLDLDDAWEAVVSATKHGMKTAVAFIVGFPEETLADLRCSVHFFIRSTRIDNAEPQMSLLAPLAGTPIEKQFRNQLVFDHIYSDMSHQGWREDPNDLHLIQQHPDIFPNFYSVPALLPRPYVREIRDFVHGLTIWFRWLPVALLDATNDFIYVFDEWVRWHDKQKESNPDLFGGDRDVHFYCTSTFANQMLAFVTHALGEAIFAEHSNLRFILEYEKAIFETTIPKSGIAREGGSVTISLDETVKTAPNVAFHTFSFQLCKLLDSIRNGATPEAPISEKCMVAFVASQRRPVQILQLTPNAEELIALCDGKTTVGEIIDLYSNSKSTNTPALQSRKAALAGLGQLIEDGILEVFTLSEVNESNLEDQGCEIDAVPDKSASIAAAAPTLC